MCELLVGIEDCAEPRQCIWVYRLIYGMEDQGIESRYVRAIYFFNKIFGVAIVATQPSSDYPRRLCRPG
jgi:hypothetical protein